VFLFQPILCCSPALLIQFEQQQIDLFDAVNNGYNVCPTAGNMLGFRHSPETIKKFRRRHPSDAQKEALSKANTGKSPSLETRAKLSKVWKGRKHNAKSKLKMSKNKKGTPLSETHKAALRGKRGKLPNVRLSKLGNKNPNFGKPRSEETRRKIREANVRTWYTKRGLEPPILLPLH